MSVIINANTLKKKKIPELKNILKDLKLKRSGNKDVLISRILKHSFISSKSYSKNETPYVFKHAKNTLSKKDVQKFISMCLMKFDFDFKDIFYNSIFLNIIDYTVNFYKLTTDTKLVKRLPNGVNTLLPRYYVKQLCNIKAFYELIESNHKYSKQISKIQKCYKKYLLKKINNLRGPAFQNRKICVNSEDFLTYDELSVIEPQYFFSFSEKQYIYGCDIRSLYEYTCECDKLVNPYSNKKMSKITLKNLRYLYEYLKKNNYNLIFEKKEHETPYLRMKEKALNVFQRMDILNNYTDVNWFLDLDIFKLKKLYQFAEDIWNYRAMDLTQQIRKKFIPNNDAFLLKPYKIFKMTNKIEIQNLILDEFNKFITEGETIEECKTGAMWMLKALVEVSQDAANSMVWLV